MLNMHKLLLPLLLRLHKVIPLIIIHGLKDDHPNLPGGHHHHNLILIPMDDDLLSMPIPPDLVSAATYVIVMVTLPKFVAPALIITLKLKPTLPTPIINQEALDC